MNAKLKKKWLKALRSGKYKQTDTSLIYRGKHCCIGVLAEISDAPLVPLRDSSRGPVIGYACRNWKAIGGLDEEDAEELAEMNDRGDSFAEIADYIEANL